MSTKETTAGHTAGPTIASVDLPWRIWWDQDHTQPPSIETVNGDLVCGMEPWLGKERAAFIVRAVNAHDELLGALKWLAGCASAVLDDPDYHRKDVEHALERARAALAKAEGREGAV